MRSIETVAMSERDGYLTGVPRLVDTVRADPDATVAFYSGLFGWEFEDRMPPGARGSYFVARLRGRDVAALGAQADDASATPAWNTSIWVDSADEAAADVRDAGGTVLMEPFDVLDSGRMAAVADSGGALVFLWQAKRDETWSDLYTRDLAAARSFYGELFGCEPGSNVAFAVDDADAATDRAAALGGDVLVAPVDAAPGRIAVLRDPDGAVFSVTRFDPS